MTAAAETRSLRRARQVRRRRHQILDAAIRRYAEQLRPVWPASDDWRHWKTPKVVQPVVELTPPPVTQPTTRTE